MSARARQEGGEHYTKMTVQPWDVIDSWPREQRIGFYRGNAIKYIMRAGKKGGLDGAVDDLLKATHYIEKLTETLLTLEVL